MHRLRIALVFGLAMLAASIQPAWAQENPDTGSINVTVHVVQYDETLLGIASQYNTTVEAIQQANNLSSPYDIIVGQRLVVPGMLTSYTGLPSRVITVAVGDTLYTLAVRYGVSTERLGALNQVVNPALLYAGQTLDIPLPDHPGRDEVTSLVRFYREYSLWDVAQRTQTNAFALAMGNGISNPVIVAPGRALALSDQSGSEMLLPDPWESVILHPVPLEPGRTGGLRIITRIPGTMQGTFLSKSFTFVSDGLFHQAIIGVDRWTAPGIYPLTLTLQDNTGTDWKFTKLILVTSGEYKREEIRLPPDIAAVLNDAQTVQLENNYIMQSMTGFSPERYWDGFFRLPTAGVMSSAFGTARSYNGGGYDSFHAGADLAAPVGTPIYAPADGVVVDTGFLVVRGYTTIIDHGWGIYTGYWHQASILVKPGEPIAAGQQIGTVGNTGLSTAAHLHWEMWVAGIQVDPLQWVREAFP